MKYDRRIKRDDHKRAGSYSQSFLAEDEATLNALAIEFISVCAAALETYGIPAQQLPQLLEQRHRGALKATPISRNVLSDADHMAELLMRWEEDPAYLDLAGRPAILNERGKGATFETLARAYFRGRQVREVLAFGRTLHVIELLPRAKVARVNNCVLFAGNELLMLAHSIRAIRRFLATAAFNRQFKLSAHIDSIPDRAVQVSISEKDFPEFLRFMRLQTSTLMELANRWLAQRTDMKGSKDAVAGAHVFLFHEGL